MHKQSTPRTATAPLCQKNLAKQNSDQVEGRVCSFNKVCTLPTQQLSLSLSPKTHFHAPRPQPHVQKMRPEFLIDALLSRHQTNLSLHATLKAQSKPQTHPTDVPHHWNMASDTEPKPRTDVEDRGKSRTHRTTAGTP